MTVQEINLQQVQVTKIDGQVIGALKVLAEYHLPETNGLAYTFQKIQSGTRTYELYSPLQCKWEIDEDNVFILENEMLVLVGTGMTLAEAVENFQGEFDEAFYSCNQYKDTQLAAHLLRAKNFINFIVKKVHE